MKLEYITIHNAIHTPEQTHVAVHGVALPINKTASGRRYVDYYDVDTKETIRFIEGEKNSSNEVFKVLDNEKVTHGMRHGNWILIDKHTSRPNLFQQRLQEIFHQRLQEISGQL